MAIIAKLSDTENIEKNVFCSFVIATSHHIGQVSSTSDYVNISTRALRYVAYLRALTRSDKDADIRYSLRRVALRRISRLSGFVQTFTSADQSS